MLVMRHIGWVTGSSMALINVVTFIRWHNLINLVAALFCATIAAASWWFTTRKY